MNNLFYFLMFSLLLIPIADDIFAETIKVQIPTGSSIPLSTIHFTPDEISARPGDKVQWGNTDSVFHTITSGTLSSGPTGMFDSGHLKPGGQFVVLFEEQHIGEIKYFCTIHPWMFGIVNIVDLEPEFNIYHNVGSGVSDSGVDIAYKVKRNLVNVEVNLEKNMISFNFAGKINNDKFIVRLPSELIKDPKSVWIDENQVTDFDLKKADGFTTLTVTLQERTQQVKVVGTVVIGKPSIKEQVLINQIFGITDKKFYESGDQIIVSGEIQNPVQLYQISLDVISPRDVAVFHMEVPLVDETKFTETIPTIGVLRELGEYTVKITAPSAKSSFMTFEYGIVPSEFDIEPEEYESPLKQVKSGTEPSEVACKEGLDLFMKNSNGDAVCLTQSTAEILLQRGWISNF